MASHQLAKFGGHRQYSSRDAMILGYYVISRYHVIEGSCNFMGRAHQGKLTSCQVPLP